jgi:hypothetical protein
MIDIDITEKEIKDLRLDLKDIDIALKDIDDFHDRIKNIEKESKKAEYIKI